MAMHIRTSHTQGSPDPLVSNGEAIETAVSPSLLSPSVSPRGSSDADHKDDDLQNLWQEIMCRSWNIPIEYLNVAVLLIRWDDSVDELKCAGQVQELQNVFKDKFNFTTELLKLHGRTKAQHQLQSGLSAFLEKHDGPHNLVIVYYTGHGVFDERLEHLEIAAFGQNKDTVASNFARASWNTADHSLIEQVECDVLSILDCCFASDIVSGPDARKKNREALRKYFNSLIRREERPNSKTYESLTASGPGQPTSSTPEHSFTGRLIQALSHLAALKKPFSTHALNQQIITYSKDETISCLLNRDPYSHLNGRHIQLEKLERSSIKRQDSFPKNPIKSYLTLKFALHTDTLTGDQIKDLIRRLAKACKAENPTVGVGRIDWVGLGGPSRIRYTAAAISTAKRWRRHTLSSRGRLGESSPSPSPSPDPSPRLELLPIQAPSSIVIEAPEQAHKIIIEPSHKSVFLGPACELVLGGAFLILPSAFLIWYCS